MFITLRAAEQCRKTNWQSNLWTRMCQTFVPPLDPRCPYGQFPHEMFYHDFPRKSPELHQSSPASRIGAHFKKGIATTQPSHTGREGLIVPLFNYFHVIFKRYIFHRCRTSTEQVSIDHVCLMCYYEGLTMLHGAPRRGRELKAGLTRAPSLTPRAEARSPRRIRSAQARFR